VPAVADPLDAAFAALSSPVRRDLVARLSGGEQSVSALAEPLGITLQGVSQHLQVLQDAGLVAREKRGRTSYCRLVGTRLGEASAWLDHHRRAWERSLELFGDYVEGLE
jgi:DNA-binding transcriptional ArsR family regulator